MTSDLSQYPGTRDERAAILRAIRAGDLQALKVLRQEMLDYLLHSKGLDGDTTLHTAAMYGHPAICEYLVQLGLDINDSGIPTDREDGNTEKSDFGTPLESACYGGSLSTVQFFLERGALVDGYPDHYATPLIAASAEGYLPIVQVLVEAGADINRENPNLHWTALDFAEARGHAEVADYLLSRGAKRLRNEKTDWSQTPGGPYIEFIERQFGPVSFASLGRMVEDGPDVVLRIARGPKKFGAKLLFTVGLAPNVGVELGIVLRMDWPMNDASMQEPRYYWPIRLLFNSVSHFVADEFLVAPGLIEAESPILKDCQFPEGASLFLSPHLSLSSGEASLPKTLLFNFVSPPEKKGPTGEWIAKTLAKLEKAKWNALIAPGR